MHRGSITFQNISFAYETAATPLFKNLTAHFPAGWTGIVGANGAGKTTILKLATGKLAPQRGTIQSAEQAIYCPQRTDDPPPLFSDLIRSTESDAYRIRRLLHISDDYMKRWDTLSHGERKRAQISVVLWNRPEILAVDEPTNHLDTEARDLVADALRSFQGIGLLVSHDRDLLDMLCRQCLFVDPPVAMMRPGGYSEGFHQADQEENHVRKKHHLARVETKRLKREAARRRDLASRAHQRLSKRSLDQRDHDAREKKNLARLTGKDAVNGKRLRQVTGRLKQSQKRQAQIKVKKTYELGIWLEGSCSKRDTLFRLLDDSIALGGGRQLRFEKLEMRPNDRIALTGPNGSGKSTLVRHIVNNLKLPDDRITYLPQEIDLEDSKEIINRVRGLPRDELGHTMTVVSRLGSRPQRLLETDEPSPGELRKVLLAMGIARVPHLIIMDEPTNHLDLPSIECLEDALRDCPCGLLLVSHDRRFLESLTRTTWHISQDTKNRSIFILNKA